MTKTRFTTTRNTYTPGSYDPGFLDEDGNVEPWTSGEWAGTGDIETLVTGDLADRVRHRTGLEGSVTIIEHHWDSGYCITCTSEETDFIVKVGDQQVYQTDQYEVESTAGFTTFAEFDEWLKEPPTAA